MFIYEALAVIILMHLGAKNISEYQAVKTVSRNYFPPFQLVALTLEL